MTYSTEHLEKMRQAVMRYRELLDIFQARLAEGESAYQKLFEGLSPEDQVPLPEKQLQGKAAEHLLDDQEKIARPILKLRFVGRDMEREFEALYNNLIFEEEEPS